MQLVVLLLAVSGALPARAQQATARQGVLAVHGGAGVITRGSMTADAEAAYRAGIETALHEGFRVLQAGGSSLDAVVAAVRTMEDSPLFNAGKGAVLAADGSAELDASIMDGRTLAAGAVAGVEHVRNPILLARTVMEHSPHVMLAGAGAEEFALEQGLEMVSNAYFITPERARQLDEMKARERGKQGALPLPAAYPRGTVGAVALDHAGNLAAATSTGGMMNKRFGRVGDSPIIGAGTYADNETCAVSATGHGEYFIRAAVAHDVSARMRYAGLPLQVAAGQVIFDKLGRMGGTGGIIAIDREGHIAMPFNTEGMFRGSIDAEGRVTIEIYGD